MVLAVANQKGGVGKTTVTLGLAEAAAAAGHKVVVVDLDPQANLTEVLHPTIDMLGSPELPSVSACFVRESGRTLSGIVVDTQWDGVQIAGSHRSMSGVDAYLEAIEKSGADPLVRLRLREQVMALDADLVLIDTQRALSFSGTAGLIASDGVLAVTELTTFGDRGLSELVTTVRNTAKGYAHVQVLGAVVNMADQTRESVRIAEGLQAAWKDVLWQPYVPRRAVIRESYTGYRSRLRDFGNPSARQVAGVFDALAATAVSRLTDVVRHQGAS